MQGYFTLIPTLNADRANEKSGQFYSREPLSEVKLATELAAHSFPSLLLKMENSVWTIPINDSQSAKMLQLISRIPDG